MMKQTVIVEMINPMTAKVIPSFTRAWAGFHSKPQVRRTNPKS